MRHVIHDLVVSDEMEAQAAHALLSGVRKVLLALDDGANAGIAREGQRQVSCMQREGPTWEETVEKEIVNTEARLENG